MTTSNSPVRVIPLIVLAGLCALATSSGCFSRKDEPPPAAEPFSGEQIRILVPSGLGLAEHWQFTLDEWSAQTGAKCLLSEYDPSAALEGAPANSTGDETVPWNEAELVILPVTQIAELARSRVLAPFAEEHLADDALNWRDLFKGLRETVGSPGRQPSILPLSSPVMVCYYRRDLLEAAGRSQPKSWDEYADLVRTLSEWAPGRTAVEPWGESFRATTFLARAVSYAHHPSQLSLFFDIHTGAPLIDSPGFVRALDDARKTFAHLPAYVAGYGPADCRREILTGSAAIALSFEFRVAGATVPFVPSESSENSRQGELAPQSAENRAESIQIGICRLPGSPQVYNRDTSSWVEPRDGGVNRVDLTAFGGLCAATTSNSAPVKLQASVNLLARVAVRELQTCFPGATKTLCRESQLSTPDEWVGGGLSPDESAQYTDTVAAALRGGQLVAELPVIGRSQYRAALTAGIGEVLAGRLEAEAALASVAERWKEISKELGIERVRDSYRTCIGLPAMRSAPGRPLSR